MKIWQKLKVILFESYPEIYKLTDDLYISANREINDQHLHLFKLMNTLHWYMTYNVTDTKKLEVISTELITYALYHFDYEHSLIKKFDIDHKYPLHFEKHINEHAYFWKSAIEFVLGKDVVPFLKFLHSWLNGHILIVDKELGELILKESIHTKLLSTDH